MWEKLSYKQKNKILLSGFVLALILASVTSFSKTVNLFFDNQTLKDKLKMAEAAPKKIGNIKTQLTKLQETISYLDESADLRKELLDNVGKTSKEMKVLFKEFKPSSFFVSDDIYVETHEIILEGDYKSLLKVIYEVEQTLKMGKLTSVRFSKEKDRATRKMRLACIINIQSLKDQKNED